MKAVVAAFNQEKALVGAFSVIVQPVMEPMDRFAALILTIFQEDLMVPTKPDFQPCPEDDDFMAALDKMVNENIAESKNIGEPKNI